MWCTPVHQVQLGRVRGVDPWQVLRVERWSARPHVAGAEVVEVLEDDMKMPNVEVGEVSKKPVAAATGRLKKLPELAAVLLARAYEGTDKLREPGQLLILPGSLGFRVILKDPTTCSQLLVQVDGWDEIETTLEGLLASKDCPWQPDTFRSQKKRR